MNTMYKYKVKIIIDGKTEKELEMVTNRLDTCEMKCLPYLKKDGDKAEITSPTGTKFYVIKQEGQHHWRFPGFHFTT